MKPFFGLFLLILIQYQIFSQDYEPSQRKFLIEVDSVYLSESMDIFKQEHFILGWHWAGPKKLTRALRMNTNIIINF
tara:strand:+ start:296 stop:526 length:231 start_codon:yes stop_codon:yes gene_type:complete